MEFESEGLAGGSNRLIQHQLSLSNDVDDLKERMLIFEEKMGLVLENQQQILGLLRSDKRSQYTTPVAGARGYSRQSSRRKARSKPSPCDISELLHLPDAIQSNIDLFTSQIAFDHSELQDELIAKECLSEDECQFIKSKPSQKDQIRLLILKLKKRGPEVIRAFLEILREMRVYQHILDEVSKSLRTLVERTKDTPACVICVMKNTVDVKDIADHLWKKELISDDLYGDIAEVERTHHYRREFWDHITHSVHMSSNREEAFETLRTALEKCSKYKHIVQYIKANNSKKLECICCRRRSLRPRHDSSLYGSVSDISTTSSRQGKGNTNTSVKGYCEDNLSQKQNSSVDKGIINTAEATVGTCKNYSQSSIGIDIAKLSIETNGTHISSELPQERPSESSGRLVDCSRSNSESSSVDSWNTAAYSLSPNRQVDNQCFEFPDEINPNECDSSQMKAKGSRSFSFDQHTQSTLQMVTDDDSVSEAGSYAMEYYDRRRNRGHRRRNYKKRQNIIKPVYRGKQTRKQTCNIKAGTNSAVVPNEEEKHELSYFKGKMLKRQRHKPRNSVASRRGRLPPVRVHGSDSNWISD